jgi:hypothetical protein
MFSIVSTLGKRSLSDASTCENAIIDEVSSIKSHIPYVLVFGVCTILLVTITVIWACQESRKAIIKELRDVPAYETHRKLEELYVEHFGNDGLAVTGVQRFPAVRVGPASVRVGTGPGIGRRTIVIVEDLGWGFPHPQTAVAEEEWGRAADAEDGYEMRELQFHGGVHHGDSEMPDELPPYAPNSGEVGTSPAPST